MQQSGGTIHNLKEPATDKNLYASFVPRSLWDGFLTCSVSSLLAPEIDFHSSSLCHTGLINLQGSFGSFSEEDDR